MCKGYHPGGSSHLVDGESSFAAPSGLGGTEVKILNRPTAAGWWWTRPDSGCLWRIVEITVRESGEIWIQEMGDEDSDILGDLPWWEWAGPLTPPVPSNSEVSGVADADQTKTRGDRPPLSLD